MSEPFIAEIRIFAGNFAPTGWANCNGQLLPIAQNTALFSITGTTYGGDGETTFALPDLRDRVPIHAGRGPGLTSLQLGQRGGADTVTLTEAQMPAHGHTLRATKEDARENDAYGNYLGVGEYMYADPNSLGNMATQSLPSAGGSQAHNNLQPYLVLRFIIALVGLYP